MNTPAAERIALMFPGQGSQRPGMGLPWRETPHWSVVERLSDHTGRDVNFLLTEADAEQLRRTDNAQLATFALEMVVLDAVRTAAPGLPVAFCAGHSLGEYSALVAAGVLDLEEAGYLVAERGAAMADAAALNPGTMAVLLGGQPELAERLAKELRSTGRRVWVANFNAPGQVVVSGTEDGVAALAERAQLEGIRIVRIPVGGAFHSPLMIPAQRRLSAALRRVSPKPAQVPVVTNVDGQLHDADPNVFRRLALRQLTGAVLWDRSVRVLAGLGGEATELVELGPGAVLGNLAKRIAPQLPVVSVGAPEQVAALAARWAARAPLAA